MADAGSQRGRGAPLLDLAPESSPSVQALLAGSRQRVQQAITRRELIAESVVGGLFLIAAIAIALGFDSGRELSVEDVLLVFVSIAVASRVVFEVGSAYTYPTQVAFVPALFMLPPEYVPLVVAAALAAGKLSEVPSGRSPARSLMALGDASYSLGPVLVILAAGSPSAVEVTVGTLLLALVAQFVVETLASRLRETLHGGASLREQLLESGWIYTVDALLSVVGFAFALAAYAESTAVLLALPLFLVLLFLARERTSRMNSVLELSEAYRGTARLLSNVIGHDDAYTGVHTRHVADLATHVAKTLRLTPDQQRAVEFGAILHDVGKIAMPKAIINKPGPLTDEEWAIMRTHTIEGQRMLDEIGGFMSEVGRIVRWSHERYDGGGYPDGLEGEEIPIESRIVFCCDAFDAMTTDRPYRRSLGEGVAIEELRANAGTQFDPHVVVALAEYLGAPEELQPTPEDDRASSADVDEPPIGVT